MDQSLDKWYIFQNELEKTNRKGISTFLEYLIKDTDFKIAPASGKHHLNKEGGLLEHSLNVLKYARIVVRELALPVKDDSVVLSSLLHDLCKVNYYVIGEEWDKEWKDKTNQWRKKQVYKIEEEQPLGHGEKSVILAVKYIDLTTPEMLAMRWHMGAFDPGIHFFYPSGTAFRTSLDKEPLVKMLAIADQMAEFAESMQVVKQEVANLPF